MRMPVGRRRTIVRPHQLAGSHARCRRGIQFALDHKMAIMTPHVMEKGLSAVEDARLDYVLTEVSAAMEIAKPAAGDIWTPDYLPAKDTLMLGK